MAHGNSSQGPTSRTDGILKIVLLYASFATLWILLSDKAVEWLFRESAQITLASTLKGWLFVAVTSLLLYRLMRRLLGRTETESTPSPETKLWPRLSLALIAVAIIGLTAGSIVSTFNHEKDKQVARLQAIADLKAGQIADWLRERDRDGHFVQSSRFFAETYRRWREAGDTGSGDVLKNRLNEYRQDRSFQGVLLLDEQNAVLWDSEGPGAALHPALQATASQAAAEGRTLRVGPYRDAEGRLHLDLVAPLLLAGDHPRPSVVLHIDPGAYLLPTLQTWPVPSGSSETLLFRRDGDEVLFLNEHRHRKDAGAMLRVPVAEKALLAAQVLRGKTKLGDLIEGADYWGVPVLGVARAIPGTDWFLVAKMDRAEAHLEANRDALWIALTGLLALFMAAAGSFLLRQHQELAFSLRERETQAEKLRALELLDAIAEGSGDSIFAKDREGRYLLFNREGARLVGKRPQEVLGRDDTSILPPHQAALIIANDRKVMEDNRTITFQENLTTADGEFTFLSTKGPLHDDAGKVIGTFGIARDITERKRAEEALRESELRWQFALEGAGDGLWDWNVKTNEVIFSRQWKAMLGFDEHEITNMLDEWDKRVHPEDKDRVYSDLTRHLEGHDPVYINEHRLLCKDGTYKWILDRGKVISWTEAGKPLRVIGTHSDISERKRAEEALQESGKRLRRAELVAQLGHWEFLLDTTGVKASDGARAIYGLEGSNWSIPDVQKIPLPEYRPMLDKALKELIEEGKPYHVEFKIRRPTDGKILDIHSIAEYSPEKGIVFGVIQDITNRRRAEEEIKESEGRFRLAWDTSPDALSISSLKDGTYIDVNNGYTFLTGYLREEVVGRSALDIPFWADPRDREPFATALTQHGHIRNFETKLLRKDGETRTILISAGLMNFGGDQHLLAVTKDIEDIKRAEEALRASEEKYRQVVENAHDAIFIAQDGFIKFPNPQLAVLSGYSLEELTKKPFLEFIHPDDREFVASMHQKRMQGGEVPSTYSFRAMDKSGNTLWAELSGVFLSWEGGPASLNFLRDITVQKKLESQLVHAQKMEAVGTLAGGIAHDFNNLLQAVQGYAELLLLPKGEGEPGYRELHEISRAARRGGELTRQLLTFSRKVESKLQPVDLNRIVEDVRLLLGRTIPKMIKIELHLTGNLHDVNADASQVEQILMNLAVNARDAMPDGGTLRIETKNVVLDEDARRSQPELSPGKYVLLAVADTGQGMDKTTLEHIFDPFFTTKEVGKGTGLGLAMVYGIVKNHHGHITCISQPGEGTTFEIYLPAVEHIEEVPTIITGTKELRGGHETVLLVDDEDPLRNLGEHILEAYGYTVMSAPDGEGALQVYQECRDRIDLVVLDLMMPGMGGALCLQKLLEINPAAKVVIASGHSVSGGAEKATESGAKAFIQKPYDVQQMLQVVRKVLDQ